MQVNISTRHGSIPQATREKIEEKVTKLPRLFERVTTAEVIVDVAREDQTSVEIRLSVEKSNDFVATDEGPAVMAAVDSVLHKLEQQLRRHKEKLKAHRGPRHPEEAAIEKAEGGSS